LYRKISTPPQTKLNARSVPMDIASARISKGITNAITAVTPPVIRVPITGISVLFVVHWKKGNSKPCRGNMAWRE